MGWRGTVRSVSAAMRAAERDAQRRYKQQLKDFERTNSAAAVEDWQLFLRDVTSVHANHARAIDWHEILRRPKPVPPKNDFHNTELAQSELDAFKPKKLDFLRGGTEKRRAKLLENLEDARRKDLAANQERSRAFAAASEDWEADRSLAERVLAKDPSGFRDVVSEYQSLSEVELIGSSISFSVNDRHVHAMVNVHDENLIPQVRRKQLASGRLSETKMPQGEYNELYQDYVCSIAIRVAADLFAILAISECYVTCQRHMLNSRSGHLEDTPILSVFFIKDTLLGLNLQRIAPSDSLANFVHEMKFKRTTGFERVEPLPLLRDK